MSQTGARLDALRDLPPGALRALIPSFLAGYITDPGAAEKSRDRITAVLAQVSDEALSALGRHLAECGSAPVRWDADPTARIVSRAWCIDVVRSATVTGLSHLEGDEPTVVVCNHRSYLDTTATDAALVWAGRPDLADRLAAVAGPKVYEDLFRRFAAACLTTLPAPQSASIEGAAKLSPRELARQAQQAIALSHDAVREGAVVLLYPEGSRTRTGRMRPFLRGIWRYLAIDGLRVVPAAILGTDAILGVGAVQLTPGEVSLHFGAPVRVDAGNARDRLEDVFDAVAALLPANVGPEPGEPKWSDAR